MMTLRRRARQIPWGYTIDPDDPQILIEVPELTKLLKIAKESWVNQTSSQEDIARWLSKKSGRAITKAGLRVRLFNTEKKIRKRLRGEAILAAA